MYQGTRGGISPVKDCTSGGQSHTSSWSSGAYQALVARWVELPRFGASQPRCVGYRVIGATKMRMSDCGSLGRFGRPEVAGSASCASPIWCLPFTHVSATVRVSGMSFTALLYVRKWSGDRPSYLYADHGKHRKGAIIRSQLTSLSSPRLTRGLCDRRFRHMSRTHLRRRSRLPASIHSMLLMRSAFFGWTRPHGARRTHSHGSNKPGPKET